MPFNCMHRKNLILNVILNIKDMNNTKHIIGICGKRRSGKDVAANHLADRYQFVNCKISQKLKQVCQILFGFSDDEIETTKDDVCEEWNITPRRAMQFIGTEMMQFELQKLLPGMQRNFWIKSMLESNFGKHERIVISDLRFVHEVEEIKRHIANTDTIFTVIRIDRPIDRQSLHGADAHISERESNDIDVDVEVKNDGSLEDLLRKIDKLPVLL